jgi:hypothetical protein
MSPAATIAAEEQAVLEELELASPKEPTLPLEPAAQPQRRRVNLLPPKPPHQPQSGEDEDVRWQWMSQSRHVLFYDFFYFVF